MAAKIVYWIVNTNVCFILRTASWPAHNSCLGSRFLLLLLPSISKHCRTTYSWYCEQFLQWRQFKFRIKPNFTLWSAQIIICAFLQQSYNWKINRTVSRVFMWFVFRHVAPKCNGPVCSKLCYKCSSEGNRTGAWFASPWSKFNFLSPNFPPSRPSPTPSHSLSSLSLSLPVSVILNTNEQISN